MPKFKTGTRVYYKHRKTGLKMEGTVINANTSNYPEFNTEECVWARWDHTGKDGFMFNNNCFQLVD